MMLHFSGKILNKVRQLAFRLQIALIHTNLFFFYHSSVSERVIVV